MVRRMVGLGDTRKSTFSLIAGPSISGPSIAGPSIARPAFLLALACFLAWGGFLPAPAFAQTRPVAPRVAESPAAALARVIGEVQDFDLAENPIERIQAGDWLSDPRLPSNSPADEARRLAAHQGFLRRLEAIVPGELSATDQTSRALLIWDLSARIEVSRFDLDRIPFSNDSGFHTSLSSLAGAARLRTEADARAWFARLQDAPRFYAGHIANLRRGIATGFVQPRLVTIRVIEAMRRQSAVKVGESPLLKPLRDLPADLGEELRARLLAEGQAILEQQVFPAQRAALAFMEEEFLPKSRAAAGPVTGLAARDLPDGEAFYLSRVKFHTTTDMTPDAIHELGLSEVARIRAAMEKVIVESGFKGDFKAFQTFLRKDKRFYAKTPEDLLREAAAMSKRIDDQMPSLFGTLPRLSYGVRPVPAEIAKGYTTGRYFPGNPKLGIAGGYIVNTHDLRARPLYELPSLTLHEAVPGHHHQIALAQELEGLPEFRKSLSVTAFIEGWGLYAEHLGYEIGFFRTPYERFGALSYEMWRACRLVADTGIHWKRWTLDEARKCFYDNSALSPSNIESELERYVAWPGQALAYKIGELTLKRLRAQAERELGARFDRRRFHDAVLLEGAMPLDLLTTKIAAFITAEKARTDVPAKP